MSPTLVHFRSVPYTAIGFFQTPLSPVTPLLTACLPVSWVTGFLSTHLLGNMPRIQKNLTHFCVRFFLMLIQLD